jgi:Amt family ammonium transporter
MLFGIHGVAGIFGAIGLSLFLRHDNAVDLAARFGPNWSIGHQIVVQMTAVGIAASYAAVVSIVLVVLVDKTLGFRLDPVRENAGMDHSLHGEHGYGLLNLQ